MKTKCADDGRCVGVIGAKHSVQEAMELNKVFEAISTRTPFVFAGGLNREELAVLLAKVVGDLVDDSHSGKLQNRKEVVLDAPALHASELTVMESVKLMDNIMQTVKTTCHEMGKKIPVYQLSQILTVLEGLTRKG
ncbi:hypothetical protein ACUIG4_27930 [Raoultella ornithinolytica]|uniref:hypothetical protein n=1 Tax=Raoultella ornithinolytica TaxID=54291 RepID=UPI00403D5BC2